LVIGHLVAADFVTLVDHCPQLGGARLPDGGAAFFGVEAVFTEIAVGAHRHIEPRAVRVGQQVFGPVMVDPGRQPGDLYRRGVYVGLARGNAILTTASALPMYSSSPASAMPKHALGRLVTTTPAALQITANGPSPG
jgi:hypothetical protein